MRICYLADAGSIHTQRWVRYFVENGHEVHLISNRPFRGDDNIRGVKLHIVKTIRPHVPIASFFINHIFNIIQVRRLLKKIKPDILHAHYAVGWGFWGAASHFHPLVLSAWGSDILVEPRKHRIKKWMVRYALKKADLITCDGENIEEELLKLGAAENKIHRILHGVDTRHFTPAQKDQSLQKRLGVSDSPVIISLRSLNPVYDVETSIKAVAIVSKKFPNVKFIIAGDGTQKNYLRDLAESLGVLDRLLFVGQITHSELPTYLALADVYVATPLSEGGVSVSAMEAMACGLPVVTTDVGDNRKWLEDGVNGFIVPVKSPETLASKIIYLVENEAVRRKIAQANRQKIVEQADYTTEMGKMESLYNGLIDEIRQK